MAEEASCSVVRSIKHTVRSGCVSMVLTLIVLLLGQWSALAQMPSPPPLSAMARKCANLAAIDFTSIPDAPTEITSAKLVDVPAEGLPASPRQFMTGPMDKPKFSQYCEVTGYVAPQNKFDLKLPLESDWNEKLFFSACGGFCGSVDGNVCNFGLARGYATVTGNGGHDGGAGLDGLWARGSPAAQEDFGWRSDHVVALAAKAITARFYGKPLRRSYMAGCFKGGESALLQAQRFPADFDGLIPAAALYEPTRSWNIGAAWFAQAVDDGHGGSVLNKETVETIHRSVLAQCSAQSGVDEGIVTDPLTCAWKPEVLACRSSANAGSCLTTRQIDAVNRLMTPPHDSKGVVLYPYAYVAGTEINWSPWNYMVSHLVDGSTPEPFNYQGSTLYQRYLDDPTERTGVTALTFNFDRDPATLQRAEKIYDATSYDLRAFKARGGKILMWHGMADGAIPFTSSIAYYQNVEKLIGGREATQEFFRLFLIPGVLHCGGGPGPFEFDPLTALDTWVETGKAPDLLIAHHSTNGSVDRSRPIYPYPTIARYVGHGNPMQMESYRAFEPPIR